MQFKEWFCENCEQRLSEMGVLGRVGSMLGADDNNSWLSKATDTAKYAFGAGGNSSFAKYRNDQAAARRAAALTGTKDDPATQQTRAKAIAQEAANAINAHLKGKLSSFKGSQRATLQNSIQQIANAFATGRGAQHGPALDIARIIYDNPDIDPAIKKTYFDGPSPIFQLFQQIIRGDQKLWYDPNANQPFTTMDFNQADLESGMEKFNQYKQMREKETGASGGGDPSDPRSGPDMSGVDWAMVNDGDALNPTQMVIRHIQSMAAEGRYGMDDIIRMWNGFAEALRDEARRQGKRIVVSAMTRSDYDLMEPYSIPRPRRRP